MPILKIDVALSKKQFTALLDALSALTRELRDVADSLTTASVRLAPRPRKSRAAEPAPPEPTAA